MNNLQKYAIAGLVGALVIGLSAYNLFKTKGYDKAVGVEEEGNKPAAQNHRSYKLKLSSLVDSIPPQQPMIIRYEIKNDKGEILRNFEIVHEKIMHFIAVRKDLLYFQHLHPEFDQTTGEFTVTVNFPTDGLYRIFPDFTPAKSEDNPQILPVTLFSDLRVGDLSRYQPKTVQPDSSIKKAVGDYQISFSFPKAVKKQQEISYTLTIGKDGQPVTNLGKYLGALGHSVILGADSLDLIHTHTGEDSKTLDSGRHGVDVMTDEKSTTTAGPKITFSAMVPEAGIYKIFTQFLHEGIVQTVDYSIRVED